MSRTLLLADDSVTIRRVVELAFGDTDIRVESVESGEEALRRLDALAPDVVLADVVMPGPNGYEICERVKASLRPVPVLLLAGTFEPFDPERARACGADGHLVKPFESRTLVQRVEALLARGPTPLPAATERAEEQELEEVLDDLAARDGAAAAAPGEAPGEAAGAARPASAPLAPTPAWAVDGLEMPFPLPDAPPDPEEAERGAGVADAPAGPVSLSPTDVDEIARAVIERLGGVEAVAREVVSRAGGVDEIARAVLLQLGGIEAIARPIVERLGGQALREVAWEVVPDLAEALIRERLREIEGEERGRA